MRNKAAIMRYKFIIWRNKENKFKKMLNGEI